MTRNLLRSSCFLIFLAISYAAVPTPGEPSPPAKWVRISANLVLDSAEDILSTVDDAKNAGANGILFSDVKALTFWFRAPSALWVSRMDSLRAGVKSRGMDFVLTGVGLGYCSGPLGKNPNLAAGYPMKDVPMQVKGGKLVPTETATVPNGGFEQADGDMPEGWESLDLAGLRTFVDSSKPRSGSRSMRFDIFSGERTRLRGAFTVRPFQQYTLSVWVKTEALTAENILVLVRNSANTESKLGEQYMSTANKDGSRSYFNSGGPITFGWTEMRLPFNSLSATSIAIVFGVYGGQSGKIWWDDVKLLSTPLLNLLRRSSLPFEIKTTAGRTLTEGSDYSTALDPKLGQSVFTGQYDSYHSVPPVEMRETAALLEGDEVLLSGYHTLITLRGQVGCSWLDAELFSVVRQTYSEVNARFSPDAYLLAHDEIRTGGWEPAEVAAGTSGEALAAYMRKEVGMVESVTDGKPMYVWSDMFDEGQNAVENFYHVRGTLAGSWKGLDTSRVVVVNWEDSKLAQNGEKSVTFFADKGFTQVIAGFYDREVGENYRLWQKAIDGRATAGSMYTTWSDDFAKLDDFGQLWW